MLGGGVELEKGLGLHLILDMAQYGNTLGEQSSCLLPEYVRWPLHPVEYQLRVGIKSSPTVLASLIAQTLFFETSLWLFQRLISLERRTMASIYRQYATKRVNSYGYLWDMLQVHMTIQHGSLLLYIEGLGPIAIQRSIFWQIRPMHLRGT